MILIFKSVFECDPQGNSVFTEINIVFVVTKKEATGMNILKHFYTLVAESVHSRFAADSPC